MKRWGLAISVIAALGLTATLWSARRRSAPATGQLSVTSILGGGEAAGFERAYAAHSFTFPQDHGPHPGFRNEWWYFTGNLDASSGEHFGYQLTFFRSALAPPTQLAPRASDWSASQVSMADFTLTDVAGHRFWAFDRFSRNALGLAGAQLEPFRVWADDWAIASKGAETFPAQLSAAKDDVGIALTLEAGSPLVLEGKEGFSQKGPEPGNASYYYSLPRIPTVGEVRVRGRRFTVRGLTWMDREWSTSALGGEQVGWDWFSIQLSDGRNIMFYRLRRRDGTVDAFSAGALIETNGQTRSLSAEDVKIQSLSTWTSRRDGTVYPSGWRLVIPSASLELRLTPYLADQELNLSVRYWEGAVKIEGSGRGAPLSGNGYVELTGY